VVGDGDHLQPLLPGALDDLSGRKIQAGTRRKAGVDMKVPAIFS